ncbi:unnamed protein product [Macrosiphum euphorbiae]|uniref:Uncharacterized protein n=1 Tax=Macrosiphum euphorbiae TaxID=13131 RepID=A0AAV0W759_9HEMI|nr:unnamed protein product [Macrosiphum euphorbiae]
MVGRVDTSSDVTTKHASWTRRSTGRWYCHSDNVVVDPSAVLKTPPSTPEFLRWLADCQVLTGRDGDAARRRWSSTRNVALPSELEQGTAEETLWTDHTLETKNCHPTLHKPSAVPCSSSDSNATFLVEDHRFLAASPSRLARTSRVDGGVFRTADG